MKSFLRDLNCGYNKDSGLVSTIISLCDGGIPINTKNVEVLNIIILETKAGIDGLLNEILKVSK